MVLIIPFAFEGVTYQHSTSVGDVLEVHNPDGLLHRYIVNEEGCIGV